jgi:hypothetical protein
VATQHQIASGHKRCCFICAGAPDFAVGYDAAKDLTSLGPWTRIVHRNGLTASQIAFRGGRRAWPLRFILLRMNGSCRSDGQQYCTPE